VDYESLDRSQQEYAVKRLEASLKAFGPGFHVYQYLFKSNRPDIPFAHYDDPIVEAAIDQRRKFFEAKRDRLYQVEIFYCILLEGSRSKTGVGTRAFANLKQISPHLQRWPERRPEYLAAFDSASEGCEAYYLCTNFCGSHTDDAVKNFSDLAHRLFSEIMEIPEDRHPEFGMATPELVAEKAHHQTKQFIIDLLNTPSSYYLVAREGHVSVVPVTEHGQFLASRGGHNEFSTVGISAAVTSTLLNQNAAASPVLSELEKLINNRKVHEDDLQRFFTSHPELLFALNEKYCEIRPHVCLFDARRERLVPDFMARVQDSNIWNLIELKLPTSPMTVCGQTIEKASAAAARGIAELLVYRDFLACELIVAE